MHACAGLDVRLTTDRKADMSGPPTKPERAPGEVAATMRPAGGVSSVKRAETDMSSLIVTVQLAAVLPVHGPAVHPAKVEPVSVAAVSVTDVPSAYSSVQSVPHDIPVGALVTVPDPTPGRLTVSVRDVSWVSV